MLLNINNNTKEGIPMDLTENLITEECYKNYPASKPKKLKSPLYIQRQSVIHLFPRAYQ